VSTFAYHWLGVIAVAIEAGRPVPVEGVSAASGLWPAKFDLDQ
jgi:hypothetical protein